MVTSKVQVVPAQCSTSTSISRTRDKECNGHNNVLKHVRGEK